PAALAGAAGHLPSAVVPPQRRQRVHGPDPRRVRRQGRGLRAGRLLAAQLHDRARTGRGDLREGLARRPVAAGCDRRHHGLHVRDTRGAQAEPAGGRGRAPAARLPGLLGGAAEALHSARLRWRRSRERARQPRPCRRRIPAAMAKAAPTGTVSGTCVVAALTAAVTSSRLRRHPDPPMRLPKAFLPVLAAALCACGAQPGDADSATPAGETAPPPSADAADAPAADPAPVPAAGQATGSLRVGTPAEGTVSFAGFGPAPF